MQIKQKLWEIESAIFYRVAMEINPKVLPISKKRANEKTFCVSLTSYPPRFSTLAPVIKSLLNQSVPADLINLWVAYSDYEALPDEVLRLQEVYPRFSIKQCSDLRSYKKIVPAVLENSQHNIVIADDDVLYSRQWLAELVKQWSGNTKEIVAHRVHEIRLSDTGFPVPYQEWRHNVKRKYDQNLLFATGCGGVLYPKGSLHKDVVNQDIFLKLCPDADDLWLHWMRRRAGSKCITPPKKIRQVDVPGCHDSGLARKNVHCDGNDVQLRQLANVFGPAW